MRKLWKLAALTKQLLLARSVQAEQAIHSLYLKEVTKRVHLKQVKRLEDQIEETLEEFFLKQVYSAVRQLKQTEEKDVTAQIFNPNEWNEELVDRLFPVFAQGMIEAAKAQIELLKLNGEKSTTATEYLEGLTDADIAGLEFSVPTGTGGAMTTISLNIATEFPPYMLDAIEDLLHELFEQDFWTNISQTTLNDINQLITQGLQEGWPIPRMASEIAEGLAGSSGYALRRAVLIARTESGNILNGARSRAIDKFLEETGLHGSVKKVWLSVLGNTTRDTHANLDGVPADNQGMWFLAGYRVRWPGDINLPPGERCNCQCTINTEFGMQNDEAEALRQEYEQRRIEYEAE